MSKRYYWLKLKHDFFEQQEVRIIEQMPGGKDYVLFYLKLLCKSVTTEGKLRFNEQIPYDEEMLSVITNTDAKIVHEAVKVFEKFHLMEILDDGTYFMHEVEKMMGSETYWAQKKREQRSKDDGNLDNVQNKSNECPQCPTKREDIYTDTNTDSDIHTDTKQKLEAIIGSNIDFSLEKVWHHTLSLYPRKSNYGNSYEVWLRMIIDVPGREKELTQNICNAIIMYTDNYKATSNDEEFKYVPGFERWLNEECSIWLERYEKYEREESNRKAGIQWQ